MARTARPSDLYRLPEHSHADQATAPRPEPPSRRRLPTWVGIALVLAAVLVISGVLGTTAAPVPGEAPLVDIVSEDQAIAALTLYGAQASTIAELQERKQIYANPGPGDAARVAALGAAETERALSTARALPNPDPLVQSYVQNPGHAANVLLLHDAQRTAGTIALFASTHDTLYSGSGSIPLDEAYKRIASELSGGGRPAPLDSWGRALMDIIEERGGRWEAMQGRANSQEHWAQMVTSIQPAGVAALQAYIDGLPTATMEGLRGHPVAGPALEMLEQQRRLAS